MPWPSPVFPGAAMPAREDHGGAALDHGTQRGEDYGTPRKKRHGSHHAVCRCQAGALYWGRCQQPFPQSLESETVSGALLSALLAVRDNAFVCIALVAVVVFLATSTRRSAHRCPRCKEINREAAIYCAQCGTRLRKK
ncbi:MAG: hypothetical protein IH987_08160 [Planctomycetes bacterium]|nr:hypothetical protein [Planctomycetota bacterium]